MSKNLAHPIGHKLKFNGKHLAIGGQWHNLWSGKFSNFTTNYSEYYYIEAPNHIETNITDRQNIDLFGKIEIYYKFELTGQRKYDNYILLEIPFVPYRTSRNKSLLEQHMTTSTFKFGISKQIQIGNNSWYPTYPYYPNFSFDIQSTPTAIGDSTHYGEGFYGPVSWTHTLSIPNISYTNTFSSLPDDGLKIRLLCDLKTKKTYFKIASSFPNEVKISDYIDTGFDMETRDYSGIQYYVISLYADGWGRMAPTSSPESYIIAGYDAGDTVNSITLKSYLGTL